MKGEFFNKIKWKHILLLFISFLCMMAFMRYTAMQVKNISGGTGVLDLDFGNSVENIRQAIDALGNKGRSYYLTHFLVIDFFYAMVYAAFYFFTIAFLLQKNGIRRKRALNICLFPIAGMFFDWSENLFLCILIVKCSTMTETLCLLFIICNVIKFLFVYLSLLVVIMGVLYYFFRKVSG